jgi:hypothetical protein
MASSQEQVACGAVIGLPIAVVGVTLILYIFFKPAKDFIESSLKWLDSFVLWKLFNLAMACLTLWQIVETWTKLGSLTLSTEPPEDRCVPLFFSVAQFVQSNNVSSALYGYSEQDGTQSSRLCTSIPESEVKGASFSGADFLSFPDFNGCSFADFASNCTTVDKSDPNALVPPCSEFLQTTPMPYGFLYKSTYSAPESGCSVQLKVQQELQPCKFAAVYRLRKLANKTVVIVLSFALSISTVIPFFGIWIIYKTSVMKNANEKNPETGDECCKPSMQSYAFAMETPFGEVVKILNCCDLQNWNTPESIPPLTPFYFGLLQTNTFIEAAALPILAVSGCPLCHYPKIYVVMLYKICQFVNAIFTYLRQNCAFCKSPSQRDAAATEMQQNNGAKQESA